MAYETTEAERKAEAERLDMTTLLALLDEVRTLAEQLDGAKVDIQINNKRVMATKSQTNKTLLYTAHLADLVKCEVMNQYYVFKGENPPTITT